MQKRKLDKVGLTIVSKPSLQQVHEKRRLEAPERAKKLCLVRQATIISSEICNEVKKPFLLKKGAGMMMTFFLMNAQNIIFFQLPNLKKILFGWWKWLLRTR